MYNNIEVLKCVPKPRFENNINEIKVNHLKNIASAAMNLSALTLLDNNLGPISINNSFEA